MRKVSKWLTINLYVDIDTGEMLTKEQCSEYNILRTTKEKYYYKETKNYRHETIGVIRRTNECTKRGTQLTIF